MSARDTSLPAASSRRYGGADTNRRTGRGRDGNPGQRPGGVPATRGALSGRAAPPLRRVVNRQLHAQVTGQSVSGASVRLARRLARAIRTAGTRRGCDVSDAIQQLSTFMTQLTAMAARR